MPIFEISLFGFTISPTYYGLMYTLSFIIGYIILAKRKILYDYELDNLLIYLFLGVILGGRFGYVIFYDLHFFLQNPIAIIQVWNGGMSFHGGLIGVILSVFIFSMYYKIAFWRIIDELAAIVPIGLGLGRIGNYINKELLGFPYTGPFAVEIAGQSYFPSPLLEAFLEGIVLFFLLQYIQQKKTFIGQTSAFFLIIYGTFRIIVEVFFRIPDENIGYLIGPLSLGAILSFPMIILGIYLLVKFSLLPRSKQALRTK